MHFYKMKGAWRRLPGRSKVQIVLIGVALAAATSAHVIARPGNDNEPNVQRGGNSAGNIQRGGDNIQRGNSAANIQRGFDNNQRGGNDIHRGSDNVYRGGNDIRRGSDNVYRGGSNMGDIQRTLNNQFGSPNRQDYGHNWQAQQQQNQFNSRRQPDFRQRENINVVRSGNGPNINVVRSGNGTNINVVRNPNDDRWNHRRNGAWNNRTARRWDSQLDNRGRYQAYSRYRNNWNQQRTYLNSNLSSFNQLSQLNQLQQAQLDSQLRAAYLSFHNNQWNGPYGWDNYSDPRFLDYLHTNQPSILESILSALGMGDDGGYLYSSNWGDERSQLARNIARIHQLAVEGRITRQQERDLMDQLRAEFMAYHNNNWDRPVQWSTYSDPGFVDYLNTRRPSLLSVVRDYLVM